MHNPDGAKKFQIRRNRGDDIKGKACVLDPPHFGECWAGAQFQYQVVIRGSGRQDESHQPGEAIASDQIVFATYEGLKSDGMAGNLQPLVLNGHFSMQLGVVSANDGRGAALAEGPDDPQLRIDSGIVHRVGLSVSGPGGAAASA